jgi:hypothetical protein
MKPINPSSWTLRRMGEAGRGWPNYLFWGRVRTSTFALVIAFFAIYWLYQTYRPPPPTPVEQPVQVVPPGFMPDPEYTWVPRTNVQERPRTTTPQTTTTTTTAEPSPTETPSPTDTTSIVPTDEVPTTVVDPDGPGPLPPSTVTPTTTPTMPTVPPVLVPFGPGPGPTPTTPAVPR